jgi:predicted RNase H-like nuclease (RuvC/YqgF family)
MAKRSTIGENPLDAVIQANSLETVVPDLSVAGPGARGQTAAALAQEVRERLQDLEAGLQALRTEAAGLKAAPAEVAALKSGMAGWQAELARLGHELEQLKAAVASAGSLQAEVAQLRSELAQLRGPGDLPWWMRGKKR